MEPDTNSPPDCCPPLFPQTWTFTLTDADGNEIGTEVIVIDQPSPESSKAAAERHQAELSR